MLLSFLKTSCSDDLNDKQYRITSLGNTGIYISSNKITILIDGLFDEGYGKYDTPTSSILNSIINKKAPFNKIDMVLFTHAHPDHFNLDLVEKFKEKNSSVKIIAPKSELKMLSSNEFDCSVSNDVIMYSDSSQGISVKSYKFPHEDDPFDKIEHYIYLINIDGFYILHMGDAKCANIETFKKLNITDTIDVVVAPRWFVTASDNKGFNVLEECFHPKNVIISHIAKRDYNEYKKIIGEYKFANFYVLEKPLTNFGFNKSSE